MDALPGGRAHGKVQVGGFVVQVAVEKSVDFAGFGINVLAGNCMRRGGWLCRLRG
jgi:hypothetical protein